MPTWGQILNELSESARGSPNGIPDLDGVRRKYLAHLSDVTGRATILYSTAWFESRAISPEAIQVALSDVQGFMEAVSNIEESKLDLVLHSPGGSPEAAQSVVEYVRQRFDHVRVFVPVAAMSAATMIALSADVIVMGQHSQLGPTDPQFIISTPEGTRTAPAQAILDQFALAKKECRQDPANVAAWMPIIRTYAPGLLTQCQRAQGQAVTMVAGWLERFMLAGSPNVQSEAKKIAEWFTTYANFGSHGERVGRETTRELGVEVQDLEEDGELQDALLSVHHATMHTFSQTNAMKIIENHHGRAWILSGPPAAAPASRKKTPEKQNVQRQNRGKRKPRRR